nr:antitoxin VbhA family protein [uncultured Haemophilus sp.]
MISIEEQTQRREAIEYAKGSVGLEGIYLSDELLGLTEEYIKGDLTDEQFSNMFLKIVDK